MIEDVRIFELIMILITVLVIGPLAGIYFMLLAMTLFSIAVGTVWIREFT